MAAESPVQERLKIIARKEDIFKTAMAYSHWKIDPGLVRAFINKSGDTIRWLEEKGISFVDVPNYYHNQVPRIYHVPKGYGAHLVKILVDKGKELGVKIYCGTAANQILIRDGAVEGVLAKSKDREIRIGAKTVIIATGGYSGNNELLKKYCPHYTDDVRVYGVPNMGDGLIMATSIGAATEGLGTLLFVGPFFPGSLQVFVVCLESNTIWVNKEGMRFIDESMHFASEIGNALNRQPGKISYTLFDEVIKQSFVKGGLIKGIHRSFPSGSKVSQLQEHLQKEAARGTVKITDSWEAIAEWISADPRILKKTIKEYNEGCDRAFDNQFYKDRAYLQPIRKPPYYAIRCHQGMHGTTGGIKINDRMEVLDQQNKPIRGLYAAGNDAGGWISDTYCYILSGTALAFAINSARIAGENAVKYIADQVGTVERKKSEKNKFGYFPKRGGVL
jgi:fumarate reductase flavoprotein subunit